MVSCAKANFYQLNLNYLLSTAYESLLDRKAKYDPTDQTFLSAIISGYNRLDFKVNQHFMFKTYFIYLFNLLKRYMVKKEEEILREICVCVMEPTSQRSVPLDLIDKFRFIICKKAAYINLNNLATDKYKIDFIDVGEKLAMYTDEPIEHTDLESYDDDAFWEEICQLVKNEQIFTFSLLSKISNNPEIDLVENEEKEIEFSKLFRKRKTMYDSCEDENTEPKKSNKKPKKTGGPSPKKMPLAENNQVTNTDLEVMDEEMNPSSSPVRSIDLSVNKWKRTPIRVSREQLIEIGLQTAEETQSSSDDEEDTVVSSKPQASGYKDSSARNRKQPQPKKKLKAVEDSSQCSEDGSILKTTMTAEEEHINCESTSESLSESESEKENEVETKTVSFREADACRKKKVPITRFDSKADSKYLDSEYSGSEEEDEDELDFNESFNTKNKNALKDNLTKVKRKSLLKKSSIIESDSASVDSSEKVARSRSKSNDKSPSSETKLTRRQSTRSSIKNDKVRETRSRSRSSGMTSTSPKLTTRSSARNLNKNASEKVEETRSRSRSTGTTPKSPMKQTAKEFSEEIEDVKLSDDNDINRSMNESRIKKGGRKFWTEKESAYLVLGVKLYGKGNWAMILSNFSNKLRDRTQVHLKDRYRTLQKHTGELKKIEKIADEFYKSYSEKD